MLGREPVGPRPRRHPDDEKSEDIVVAIRRRLMEGVK
jgi:K+-sensing histidine kinase KdpD